MGFEPITAGSCRCNHFCILRNFYSAACFVRCSVAAANTADCRSALASSVCQEQRTSILEGFTEVIVILGPPLFNCTVSPSFIALLCLFELVVVEGIEPT